MTTDNSVFLFKFGQKLEIVQGDLTEQKVDAIVNAANEHLLHGGGVAGSIVLKGGDIIQRESIDWVKNHGIVTHENPAYTSAGRLPARIIIHAVGPVWGSGNEDEKLSAAINGSLMLAERLNLNSIAFPAISTGIFGFPKERAAVIILQTIRKYFSDNPSSQIYLVRLTLFDQVTYQNFSQAFNKIFLSS